MQVSPHLALRIAALVALIVSACDDAGEDGVCIVGSLGCPCGLEDRCDDGSECLSGICVGERGDRTNGIGSDGDAGGVGDAGAADASQLDAGDASAAHPGEADAGGDAATPCEPRADSACHDGHVHWIDSCGVRGTLRQACDSGCTDGRCDACIPSCASDAECGEDGCGGDCGTCSGGAVCQADATCACEAQASSDCVSDDVVWFDSCGTQGAVRQACDFGCSAGSCDGCTPACGGRQCGEDGCGGDCGSCTGGAACQPDGSCACEAQASSACASGDVYWFDSCGAQGAVREACDEGCFGGTCVQSVDVGIQVVGDGSVTVGATVCTGTCNVAALPGDLLTFTAAANAPQLFREWSDACTGTDASCQLTVLPGAVVTATFEAPNIIFVSSTTSFGDFGGIAAADAICNAAAAGKLPGTYQAWLADSNTVSLPDRFAGSRGWVRPDGLPVADTPEDIGNEISWYAPLLDEDGNELYTTHWTGTHDGVTPSTHTCGDWTSPDTFNGTGGYNSGGAIMWNGFWNSGCSSGGRHFLCLGVGARVRLTPPTTSGRLAFVSEAGLRPSDGGGLAAADAICAQEANDAGLAGSFKALIASSTASAASRFSLTGATWVRPDGMAIFDSAGDLGGDTSYLVAIAQHADGGWVDTSPWYVWAGAPSRSVAATSHCDDWTSDVGTSDTALLAFVGPESFAGQFLNCTQEARLVCLQE